MQQTHTSLFFMQEHNGRKPMHGGVGNTDIESILLTRGFQPILFPYQESFSIKAKIFRFVHLFRLLLSIPSNAIIIFQFPLYARMNKFFLKWAGLKKKLTVICLIADIDGLKSGNNELLKIEKARLLDFRYFIIHNIAMQLWLNEFIPDARTARIEFFDFLAEAFKGKEFIHGRGDGNARSGDARLVKSLSGSERNERHGHVERGDIGKNGDFADRQAEGTGRCPSRLRCSQEKLKRVILIVCEKASVIMRGPLNCHRLVMLH